MRENRTFLGLGKGCRQTAHNAAEPRQGVLNAAQVCVTSHRSQVSTKTCSEKVSIRRLRACTPTTLSQPAMASNRLIAMPSVRPACCRPGLQRCQRAVDAQADRKSVV